MNKKHLAFLVLFAAAACVIAGCSGKKDKKNMNEFLKNPEKFPVSFKYEGVQYKGFGKDFTRISDNSNKVTDGTEYEISFRHTPSGALFTLKAKSYDSFDACEWTVYITNEGSEKTGVFSEILACDIEFEGNKPILKGIHGDLGAMYEPYEISLTNNTEEQRSTSGRPTHGNFPYYNLEYGDRGTFIALGWPGCWKARFENSGGKTHFTGGQLETEMYLEPGETVRTPLVAFLNYEGRNELENMNLWRRWFIECNMHKDTKGNVIGPVIGYGGIVQGTNTAGIERIIKSYIAHDVPLDYMWLDAGWYPNANGETCGWPETGMWTVNESMFPDKFADISQLMHENGGKTLLWFEPEVVRCNKEDYLAANTDFKEEWMLGTAAAGTWLEGQLLDLGNEELRNWLLNKIFTVLDEGGIDMYRQDFNVDPAPVWSACDGINRIGFTENQYVQGYLALWDAILVKYPDMTIDSCASGGGRNDLETLRRAVPLHASDFWDGNGDGFDERQAMILSLSQWIPYFKLETHSTEEVTEYKLRSSLAPWININVATMKKSTPWDTVKKVYDEHKRLSEYYYADFYPLTPVNKSKDVWRAMEYYDVDTNSGAVLAFRAENCPDDSVTLKLYGLSDRDYVLENSNTGEKTVVSGKKLKKEGLSIVLTDKGSSVIYFISEA